MIDKHLALKLHGLISDNEDRLMQSILHSAIDRGYSAYTSTLVEPWRLSICGLSAPLLEALTQQPLSLELHPDEDYSLDAIADFGIHEARLHRRRGISIATFLGLFKYYRQAYLDLLEIGDFTLAEKSRCTNFLHRYFDRIELGLCGEWIAGSDAERISELQASNRTMTNEKNKYLTLFESLSHPVVLLTKDGFFDRLNGAAAEWLQLAGNRFYAITPDADAINCSLHGKYYTEIFPWLDGCTEKLSDAHKMITLHRRVTLWDKHFDVDVLCSAMVDISEKFSGYVLVFSDLTREYKLISDLRITQTKLETSNRRLEQFAYSASHDLREPLRMVNSYLQLLAEQYQGKLDAKADMYIHYSRDGALRMQDMIDSLLDLSRLHIDGKSLKKISMNKVVASALAGLQDRIEKTAANIVFDTLPAVWADKTQMIQLMQNIIGNSLKYNKNSAMKIKISAKQDDGAWVFSVQDNGIGIDEKDHERIFRVFSRLHTREEYEGTGLGLAICQAIVERHLGRIWVTSAPGGGAIFSFSLPENSCFITGQPSA